MKNCKYGFYTCSNLIKQFHCNELCENCDEGQNYQHKDDFKLINYENPHKHC